LVLKLNKLASICINGEEAVAQFGVGPGGSGPIENSEEIVCDILTEVISTLFKIYTRIFETSEALKLKIEAEKIKHRNTDDKLDASQAAELMETHSNGSDIPEQICKMSETEIQQ
jgi:hypothetical protein